MMTMRFSWLACFLLASCGPTNFRNEGGAAPDASTSDEAGALDDAGSGNDVGPDGGGGRDGKGGPGDGGGGRVSSGLVGLWRIDEAQGTLLHDTSGVGPALDLTIGTPAAVTWKARGLVVTASVVIASSGGAAKIVEACKTSGEATFEAWIAPQSTTQGAASPSRILGISQNTSALDMTLSQYGGGYLFRIRTSTSGEGLNDVNTAQGSTNLTHVVLTREAGGRRVIWVDGVAQLDVATPGGDLTTWDPAYRLLVANEEGAARPWLGEIDLLAIYSRALTATEVAKNFAAGP